MMDLAIAPTPTSQRTDNAAILQVQNLSVTFSCGQDTVEAVKNVSWQLKQGECLAIVGESGSGKSASALGVMGLLPPTAHVTGRALFDGRDVLQLSAQEHQKIRGNDIAMVFQDPLSALNPVYRIGHQIAEAIRVHQAIGQKEAWQRAVELLDEVGIANPQQRSHDYPHHFSGGMRQRVVIAMALANNPRVLIADEPTTALDVTVQAQIMDLLAKLRESRQTAMVLITHDLGLVAGHAHRALVMYKGEIVERAAIDDLFYAPQHTYTKALLGSLIRVDTPRQSRLQTVAGQLSAHAQAEPHQAASCCPQAAAPKKNNHHANHTAATALLEVQHITKSFGARTQLLKKTHAMQALRGVSLTVHAGETLALVGESGSGKSTLGRCILRLHEPDSGTVTFNGENVLAMNPDALRQARQNMQMVFQDPYDCLNPKLTVRELLSEPFAIHNIAVENQVEQLLERVGLQPEHAKRYPHAFSGGQLQRIVIARAIALNPKLLVCDEPVSALDVSIQAQIINLLRDIQAEFGMGYLFIAHDLSVVRHIADRVAVMYKGEIVEQGDTDDVFTTPQHPYTQKLLSAAPIPDPAAERARRQSCCSMQYAIG